jgi:PAS domain S-box-containing protein
VASEIAAGTGGRIRVSVRTPPKSSGQAELKASLFDLVLDNISQGVSVFDRDLKVAAFNRRFLQILGFPEDYFHFGDSFEKFMRYNAERGDYGPGNVEDLVQERLQLVRRFEPHLFERARPDGTVIEIRGWPIQGGGFFTTYTDITARRRAEAALRESEEWYALVMRATGEGVYDWNLTTDAVSYSPRVRALLGLGDEDLRVAEDWIGRIHPDDLPGYRKALIAHLKGETERFEFDLRYRAGDGSWRWARQHGFALRDASGRAYRMAGSTGDITDRRALEGELETARRHLAETLESVSAGISLFDADDRLVLCNSHYKDHYPGTADLMRPGIRFEEILRAAAARGIVAEAVGREEEWVAERLARHRNPQGPLIQRQSDGRWIQIDERRTGDGGTVAVFSDVSELKQREQALALAVAEKDSVLAEFNAVMDTIEQAVLFMGPDLRPRITNRAFRRMWGFAEDLPRELTMRQLMEFVRSRGYYTVTDAEFEEYARLRIEEVRAGDTPPRVMQRGDGTTVQYQVKNLADGGRLATYFDITELKKTEDALRQSEQRFRDFASSSSDWFWEIGPDLRFTFVSEPMEQTTKIAPARVLGRTREELWAGDSLDPARARHLEDLRAHRPFKDFRYELVIDPGETLWISTSGIPLFDAAGAFQGYRGTGTDITEAVHREQELREAKEQAERALAELKQAQTSLVHAEKLALLGQLVAGIAHEIKNPLNFVNNFSSLSVELLAELKEALAEPLANLDEGARADIADLLATLTANLAKIGEHGGRADGIVKGMLAHSREGPGERRPTDLNALVEESLGLAYHGARAADSSFNVAIERDFAGDAGSVQVVPQDISRVLLNLFANGFYATHKRQQTATDPGYRPVLRVSTRRKDGAVEVRVRDNGAGIPKAVVAKIFTPFFTTKPAGEGTGLGLSLSHDIVVHQHGGKLEVESLEGEYAEFTIRLPAETVPGSGKEAAE